MFDFFLPHPRLHRAPHTLSRDVKVLVLVLVSNQNLAVLVLVLVVAVLVLVLRVPVLVLVLGSGFEEFTKPPSFHAMLMQNHIFCVGEVFNSVCAKS